MTNEEHEILSIDHLSDGHYRLIGRAVIAWAHIEEEISRLYVRTIGLDALQALEIKNAIRSFKSFEKQLRKIWKRINKEIYTTELNKILDDCNNLSLFRNKFAHRPWYSDGDERMFSGNGTCTVFPFENNDHITVEELSSYPRKCLDVINRINDFWDKNQDLIASSRDTHLQEIPCK